MSNQISRFGQASKTDYVCKENSFTNHSFWAWWLQGQISSVDKHCGLMMFIRKSLSESFIFRIGGSEARFDSLSQVLLFVKKSFRNSLISKLGGFRARFHSSGHTYEALSG